MSKPKRAKPFNPPSFLAGSGSSYSPPPTSFPQKGRRGKEEGSLAFGSYTGSFCGWVGGWVGGWLEGWIGWGLNRWKAGGRRRRRERTLGGGVGVGLGGWMMSPEGPTSTGVLGGWVGGGGRGGGGGGGGRGGWGMKASGCPRQVGTMPVVWEGGWVGGWGGSVSWQVPFMFSPHFPATSVRTPFLLSIWQRSSTGS